MCDRAFSEDPFILKYFLDRYKTQEMCDIAVDNFLPTLKFAPDWFVRRKMIKKLYNALFTDDKILFFDEDSSNATFSSDQIGIFSVERNNVNLDESKFYKDDPKVIFHVRLDIVNLNNSKYIKIK